MRFIEMISWIGPLFCEKRNLIRRLFFITLLIPLKLIQLIFYFVQLFCDECQLLTIFLFFNIKCDFFEYLKMCIWFSTYNLWKNFSFRLRKDGFWWTHKFTFQKVWSDSSSQVRFRWFEHFKDMLYTSSDLFVINISALLYFQDTPTQLESNISKKLNFNYRAAQKKHSLSSMTIFFFYSSMKYW